MKVTWAGMSPGDYVPPPDKTNRLLEPKLKMICDRVIANRIYDYGDPSVPKYIPVGTTITLNITPKNLLIERTFAGTSGEPPRYWIQEY